MSTRHDAHVLIVGGGATGGVIGDLDLRPKTQRRVDRTLWAIGTGTIGYGMALLITLAARG